jgi:mRNA interferase MazF
VITRGSVCWVEPGSGPRVPVVVVQAEPFNQSRIPTVVVVPLSGSLRLAEAPGNVLVPPGDSRLGRDLVANVAHPLTLERRWLRETPGRVSDPVLGAIGDGLRLVLSL